MLLIADMKLKRGRDLADMMRWMGIVAVAAKPMDALGELNHSVSALLVVNPNGLPDAEDYINRARAYARTLPIFALLEEGENNSLEHLFLGTFKSNIMTSTLIEGIRAQQMTRGQRPLGDYVFAGIDASCTHDEILYHANTISMTSRQKMILRYLFCTYPTRVCPEMIAKHIYRPGTEPESSCIRAHICAINKKLSPYLGRPIIDSMRSAGYRILTSEVLRRREKGIVD